MKILSAYILDVGMGEPTYFSRRPLIVVVVGIFAIRIATVPSVTFAFLLATLFCELLTLLYALSLLPHFVLVVIIRP